MILKFNRYSKGKKGVIEYLLNERVSEGTARVIRGNEKITQALINNSQRKHKYLSGGLMFAEEEVLTEKEINEIINSFEKMMFIGINSSQYNILWVQHSDKNRLELNFVVPRMELSSGNDLDVWSSRRDLPLFNMWKNGINKKYKLVNPNDLHRQRVSNGRAKTKREEKTRGHIVSNRQNFDATVQKYVKDNQIQDRERLLRALESSGYEITRKNDQSISVKHVNLGKKALRLKGGIYSIDFTQTTRKVKDKDSDKFSNSIYQKYLQKRKDRHIKRYAKHVKKGLENDRVSAVIADIKTESQETRTIVSPREAEVLRDIREDEQRVLEKIKTEQQGARQFNREHEYRLGKLTQSISRFREKIRRLGTIIDNIVNTIQRRIGSLELVEKYKLKLIPSRENKTKRRI